MTAARLILSAAQQAQIFAEARRAYPRECCGLVEGRRDGAGDGDVIRVVAIHPMSNSSAESDRFDIDPAEHIALLRALRGRSSEIVGCYHSHPNGRAEPSARDRAGAFEDGFLWLIAAVDVTASSDLRAFLAENGELKAMEGDVG